MDTIDELKEEVKSDMSKQKDNFIAKYLEKLDDQGVTYTQMYISIIVKE